MLALSLPTQPGSFGTFPPTVARTYETAIAATVTSTAGDAVLSVTDASTIARVTSSTARSRCRPRSTCGRSTPPTRRRPTRRWPRPPARRRTCSRYTGPVNTDQVTLGFRQAIAATDVLRSGNYSKTLTFTLSTTAP